jgi:riboflavin kinase/FMN adenylyltransferase
MEIVIDLSKFSKKRYPNLVVALGNFDGVHLGHLEILKLIQRRAKQIGGYSAVFTFREHPKKVLGQKNVPAIITSTLHKLFLLEQSGIDLCFLVDFTVPLSKRTAHDFIQQDMIRRLGSREICMGFNARFGRARKGDTSLMRRLSKQLNFVFIEAPSFTLKGKVVSSSLVRSVVEKGKLEEARRLLGRPYSFFGTVVTGTGRGHTLGFPTANLDSHNEVMPPEGVYTARVRAFDIVLVKSKAGWYRLKKRMVGEHLRALLNYGKCPTFGAYQRPFPEVHILDFHKDLVGKTVEVEVGYRVRSERKFSNAAQLKRQIALDIKSTKSWFESN